MMIAPVFKYRWQLWLFVTVLIAFLAQPFLPKPVWMDRSILYHSFVFNSSYRNNIFDKIFNEPGDIDVLFVGSSTMASGVNPLVVRAALRTLDKKDASVYLVYHPSAGFDFDYIILKDILARRKVKLLVWDVLRAPKEEGVVYHTFTPYLWDLQLHKDLMQTMSTDEITLYLYGVMAGPKLLLSNVLSRGKSIPEDEYHFLCDKDYFLGACMRGTEESYASYPPPPLLDMHKILHFRGNDMEELRDTHSYRDIDKKMFEKVLDLAEQNQTQVAFMVTPIATEPPGFISIQHLDQGEKGWNVPIIGATRNTVLHELDITKGAFFQEDGTHMVLNATNYYSEMIMPAIIQLYQQARTTGIVVPPITSEAITILGGPPPNSIPPSDRDDNNERVFELHDPNISTPDEAVLVKEPELTTNKKSTVPAPVTMPVLPTHNNKPEKLTETMSESDIAAADYADHLKKMNKKQLRKKR